MSYLLAVDVGTSSTKTALRDAQGRLLSEASFAYHVARPYPAWAEMDVEVWWQAVCSTVRQVVTKARIDPRAIHGIGVDGVSWTLIPVDNQLRSLCLAPIWLDRRAESEAAWLRSQPGARDWVNLAANPLDAAYVTPKLLWLRQHRPHVFHSAAKFLNSTGFIVARMTGMLTCDLTQAYAYHFFDMRNGCWDEQSAGQMGIPLEKLPDLVAPLAVAGQVTRTAASELGLVEGIPVIAGGLDAAVGALGAGVVRLGQTVDQGGQAGGMLMSVDQVIIEPLLIFSHHVLPGQYLLQSGTVGGGSLGWFQNLTSQVEAGALGREINSLDLLGEEAAATPPGAHGLLFLPYMAGERTPLWDSNARGVFFGLSYKTTRGDMVRAIMEGCAFAVQHGLQLAEEHGAFVDEWLGDGGAARSATWCQIKADITGRPFIVACQEDGTQGGHTLGLFAMAAQAAGLCRLEELQDFVESLLLKRQVFEPVSEHHAMYAELFEVYRRLSEQLKDDFAALAGVAGKYQLV